METSNNEKIVTIHSTTKPQTRNAISSLNRKKNFMLWKKCMLHYTCTHAEKTSFLGKDDTNAYHYANRRKGDINTLDLCSYGVGVCLPVSPHHSLGKYLLPKIVANCHW